MSATALVIVPFFWPKLPPLGISLLLAHLQAKDYLADLYDLNIDAYNVSEKYLQKIWERLDTEKDTRFADEVFGKIKCGLDDILSKGYKYVGFSVYNTNLNLSLRAATYLKEKNKEVRIIFGGPEIFYMKRREKNFAEMYTDVDFFVEGEGEINLAEIISGIEKQAVPVIKETKCLDDYAPAVFVKPDRYVRKKALPVLYSRGCLRRCLFCSECMLFGKYRQRNAEKVFEEINSYYKNGVRWFTFNDSLFNPSYESVKQLCELIIDSGIEIKWDAQIAVFPWMDVSLFKLMKKAGCFNVFVGLESGSDSMLKKMQKGYSAKEAGVFFGNAKNAGLHFEVSLIVGFPGESDAEFLETVAFFKNNKHNIPKVAQINPFIMLEGSRISEKKGLSVSDKSDADKKIKELLLVLKQEKIAYTNAFINNLVSK